MALPSPEAAKGWLRTVLEVTDRATSITLVFMLLTGGLFGFYMMKELSRVRTMNLELWQRLLASERAQIEMAWHCNPERGRP